jgi:hypothetical protein
MLELKAMAIKAYKILNLYKFSKENPNQGLGFTKRLKNLR